jgi:tetratricopeptide (TPR) repeat protein
MSALGVLDAIRPDEQVLTEPVARPGGSTAPVLATGAKVSTTVEERVIAAANEASNDTVRRAERRVVENRTSTTLSALAQAYEADPDRATEAVALAREVLETALATRSDGQLLDPTSARIAAEILTRNGAVQHAYDALRDAPVNESLTIAFAAAASALGHTDEATAAIARLDSPVADAYKGYISAGEGRWCDAVRHLRSALSKEPLDVDSLLNLSISLWALGSAKKATRVALQATRVSPGRRDISLHYLELLLAQGGLASFRSEVRHLRASGVIADAKLLALCARALLQEGNKPKAVSALQDAARAAKDEGDHELVAEIVSNLISLKWELGRLSREVALQQLNDLINEYPDSDVAVVNYAALATRRSEAGPVRTALQRIRDLAPSYATYLRHQLATLEGDSDTAASAAAEWFRLEPNNPGAAAAAIVSIGIGQENWSEAAVIAEFALHHFPRNKAVVNNSAYVLAMAGRADEAIRAIEALGHDDFILRATLGLAQLARGDIATGMRLYREAADEAEKHDPVYRSLMTAYQAMVIRQLKLAHSVPQTHMEAQMLVPVGLPDDWQDRSDFIRLYHLFEAHGYTWPFTPDI